MIQQITDYESIASVTILGRYMDFIVPFSITFSTINVSTVKPLKPATHGNDKLAGLQRVSGLKINTELYKWKGLIFFQQTYILWYHFLYVCQNVLSIYFSLPFSTWKHIWAHFLRKILFFSLNFSMAGLRR